MKTLSLPLLMLLCLFAGAQSINVTYPNGNFYWPVGYSFNLTWTTTGSIPKVKIEQFDSLGGAVWLTLNDSAVNTGTYPVQLMAPPTPQNYTRFRVSDPYNATVAAVSQGFVRYANTPLSVTAYQDSTICAGNSIQMGPRVQGGTPPYTYQWAANPDLSSDTSYAPLITPTGTHPQYWVTVTDDAGTTASTTFFITTVTNLDALINVKVTNGGCINNGYINTSLIAGGVMPVTFAWSTGFTGEFYATPPPGIHTLTVTDAQGCQGVTTVNYSVFNNLNVVITPSVPTCITQSINAYPGNAFAQPLTYVWNTGNTNSTLSGFPGAGNYSVTVSDANNCTGSVAFTIQPCANLNVMVGKSNVACFGDSTGVISLGPVGWTAPYTYSTDGVNFTPNNSFTGLTAGTYTYIIKDATGLLDTVSVTLTQPSIPFSISLNISADGVFPDTVTAVPNGGYPPYGYYPSNWAGYPYVYQPGMYRIAVIDSMGCLRRDSAFIGCNNQCVWPGDANYDGLVDNNDLLPVGLAYGATGTVRQIQGNTWAPYVATDFADTLIDGTNYKHSDCNGSGVINADDTLAIVLNFGLNHPRSGADEPRGGVPVLQINLDVDTLSDGQTVVAHLLLGDALNTATNVYGLAFNFNYDPLVVDSTSVSIHFDNNSWLCNNAADHIDIDKIFYTPGVVKTALTRIDQTTRSGGGEIGHVTMRITTGNINGKNLAYYVMNTYITDLTVIDSSGNFLAVDPGLDSALIEYEVTGISQLSINSGVNIYPNPTTGLLNITCKNSAIQQYTITNLLGEVVLSGNQQNSNRVAVNTGQLLPGVYIIRVQSGNNEYVGRFIKQ